MRSNLQIVSDHYAASDRRGIAGMMADVAPDAQWTEMAGFPCAGMLNRSTLQRQKGTVVPEHVAIPKENTIHPSLGRGPEHLATSGTAA